MNFKSSPPAIAAQHLSCERYQQMKRVCHLDAVTWQRKVPWSKVCGGNVTRIRCQRLMRLSALTSQRWFDKDVNQAMPLSVSRELPHTLRRCVYFLLQRSGGRELHRPERWSLPLSQVMDDWRESANDVRRTDGFSYGTERLLAPEAAMLDGPRPLGDRLRLKDEGWAFTGDSVEHICSTSVWIIPNHTPWLSHLYPRSHEQAGKHVVLWRIPVTWWKIIKLKDKIVIYLNYWRIVSVFLRGKKS